MVKKNKIINKIAIVMGSKSDWPTMKYCADTLKKLKVQSAQGGPCPPVERC